MSKCTGAQTPNTRPNLNKNAFFHKILNANFASHVKKLTLPKNFSDFNFLQIFIFGHTSAIFSNPLKLRHKLQTPQIHGIKKQRPGGHAWIQKVA
jgi:hypothetical protein